MQRNPGVFFSMKTPLFLMVFLFVCFIRAEGRSEPGMDVLYGQGDCIYGAEIDQWTEEIKQAQRANGRRLLKKLSEALNEGAKEIRLDKAHYRFSPEHPGRAGGAFIRLKGVNQLTIHGNGAQLWFESYRSALRIEDCRNLSFNDITMDWDPLPFSQVVITAVDPGGKYIEGKTESGFRNMNEILRHIHDSCEEQHDPQ